MSKPASKPKKVGRDFSALAVAERIDITAMQLMQLVHKGEKLLHYQPRKSTQLYRVWRMGKLTERQQKAWAIFRKDFDAAEGKSGAVTSSYGEYSDKPAGNSDKTPTHYVNVSYQRIERLARSTLSREEGYLLRQLLKDDLQNNRDFTIELVGFIMAGYKEEDSARVAGVVQIQNLLNKIAAHYGF